MTIATTPHAAMLQYSLVDQLLHISRPMSTTVLEINADVWAAPQAVRGVR